MKKAVPLYPLLTPKTLWEEINIDVIGPLPKSEDKDAILVVVDQFSKMIRLMAITTSISSSKVARIYWDDIWKIHGIPKKIISNRGLQFALTFMGELYKVLEIKRAMSMAYHLQIDVSQTSFGHISINSPSILTVSMATESPWKDLSIGTSYVSRQSIMAEILGRSTGNHHGTVY